MGVFAPVPVVTLAGVDLASSPLDGSPDQVVLEGLSVSWGRDEVLEQPTPATGTVTVFDASRRWHLDRRLAGMPVAIRYEGAGPDGVVVSGVFFRGRVGHGITVAPIELGGVEGALVTLPLQSILVDAGNVTPTAAWPEETLGARATRLAGALVGVLPGGVTVRDYWKTPNVAPVAADRQVTLLEHLEALYDSSGADRYSYFPNDQKTVNLPRRELPAARGMARLVRHAAADTSSSRAGQGAFVRSIAWTFQSGPPGVAAYLDAGVLEYDDALVAPPLVTRVKLTHPTGSVAGYPNRVVELAVPGTFEALSGVRSAALDSIVTNDSYATQSAEDARDILAEEGSRWRLEPVTWRTRNTDGFDTVEQGQTLLAGGELNALMFLQRSELPKLGVRPLVGVMGGTIGYESGGWVLELVLAPVSTTEAQHAITWEEIDDGTTANQVQWWDGPHPNGMHSSLSLDDLRFVAQGVGGNFGPPNNQGWDEYQ
jgi:hypothetical protein